MEYSPRRYTMKRVRSHAPSGTRAVVNNDSSCARLRLTIRASRTMRAPCTARVTKRTPADAASARGRRVPSASVTAGRRVMTPRQRSRIATNPPSPTCSGPTTDRIRRSSPKTSAPDTHASPSRCVERVDAHHEVADHEAPPAEPGVGRPQRPGPRTAAAQLQEQQDEGGRRHRNVLPAPATAEGPPRGYREREPRSHGERQEVGQVEAGEDRLRQEPVARRRLPLENEQQCGVERE